MQSILVFQLLQMMPVSDLWLMSSLNLTNLCAYFCRESQNSLMGSKNFPFQLRFQRNPFEV